MATTTATTLSDIMPPERVARLASQLQGVPAETAADALQTILERVWQQATEVGYLRGEKAHGFI